MFIGLSKTLARFGGFRMGLGIRVTRKNYLATAPLFIIICILQMYYYIILTMCWLVYAMFYVLVVIFILIYRGISKAVRSLKKLLAHRD